MQALESIDMTLDLSHTTLSIFANMSVGLSSLAAFFIMAIMVVVNLRRRSWAGVLTGSGIALWALGEAFRVLPWGIGMWLAVDGDRYHPLLIENRHLTYGLSLPLLMGGLWMIMYTLFPSVGIRRVLHIALGLSIFIGATSAIAFIAAEHGYWFDRQEVVEYIESVIGYEHYKPIEEVIEEPDWCEG